MLLTVGNFVVWVVTGAIAGTIAGAAMRRETDDTQCASEINGIDRGQE